MTFDDVIQFHGHACPGLALGYRVANLALKELGLRARDEELVAIVENNSCAVDAIQFICGCTFGKGNFIYRDFGKQVYTFFKRPNTEALRIAVKWEAPAEDPETMAMWESYSKGDRSQEVSAAVQDRKARKIETILAADHTVSRPSVINLTNQTGLSLQLKPLQSVWPKRRRVGGEQHQTTCLCYADRLMHKLSLILMEGGYAVLQTQSQVKGVVTKAQSGGIHPGQVQILAAAE